MKNKLYWIAGIVISAFLLYLAVKDLHFYDFREAILHANLWMIFPLLVAIVLFFWIKAQRWRFLLIPVKKTNSMELVPSMVVGTAFNYLLFGYLGELVRTYLLGRQLHLSKSAVLGTIILERIFDLFTILILLCVALMFPVFNITGIHAFGYVVIFLAIVSFLTICLLVFREQTSLEMIRKALKLTPQTFQERLISYLQAGIRGLHSISSPRLLFWIILTSIGQWLVMASCNYLSIKAMGIHAPFYATFTIMALIIFGMTLPSSPGQLGVYELSYVIVLKSFDVSSAKALSAAILFHFTLYLSVMITGFILFRRTGITLAMARERGKKNGEF